MCRFVNIDPLVDSLCYISNTRSPCIKSYKKTWHSSKSIRRQEIFFKTYLKEPWKLNRTIFFAAAWTSNDEELLADSSDLINNQ